MKDFKAEIQQGIEQSRVQCNSTGYVNYITIGEYTLAVMGFYFHGLGESRVDFATYDSKGVELCTETQGNFFGVKEVLSIMAQCKAMSLELISKHNPERIAFQGAETKRYHMYERMAKRLGEGKRVWTDNRDFTVWLELYSEWE